MTPSRTRVAFVVLGVPVLLGAVLALWCSMLRLDEQPLFVQLSAFRVQVAGALLVLGALFLVRRGPGRVFGILLALVALSPLPQVLPKMLADAPSAEGDLTILVLNVYADEVDPADVATLAVSRGADVVSLPRGLGDVRRGGRRACRHRRGQVPPRHRRGDPRAAAHVAAGRRRAATVVPTRAWNSD